MTRRLLIVCALLSACTVIFAQANFYDVTGIQKIEIVFAQQNWDYMLDTAKAGKDGFIMASSVKVNGVYFDSVGVKYKGNSSYNASYDKNPLHIELNTFKNQHYQGFRDIKLSNAYADPSMIREVLAYEVLRNYMDGPQSNFAQLYINGVYWGVYTNAESINKNFCEDHFYSGSGVFIKGNPELTPSPSVKSNLKYISGDSSAYFNYYEMKSDYGWKSLQALCDSVTNKPGNIASILNVDRALWMLAFNNLLVNLDSYNGAFAQNYYLYQDPTGHFNPIVWDLNMSFGGFPFVGNSNTSLGSLSISNQQNLAANIHANDPYWPLIKAVYGNPTYTKMYIAHLKTIATEMFSSGLYLSRYNTFKSMIDTAVLKDTKKFYSNSDYQNALSSNISVGSYSVPGIQTLMSGRLAYLMATADFTNTAPVISNIVVGTTVLNQPVNIKASVTNANSVFIGYRRTPSEIFTRVTMWDDGQHNDGAANDNVYAGAFNIQGNNTQYYIYAENTTSGVFSPARAEHEFYQIDLYQQPVAGQIVINEFLANNKSDVANEFHIKEDWIELYNTTANALSLDNVYLSDESGKKTKYMFPAGAVIQPYEFKIVWADEFTGGTQLHTGFKLDENGESLTLSNGLKTVFDAVVFGPQEKDVSMARCPDGTGAFSPDKLPSYKMSNCVVGMPENNISSIAIKVYPNPAGESFTAQCSLAGEVPLSIADITGTVKFVTSITQNKQIDTAEWPSGVYFVSAGGSTAKIIISK